MELSAPPTFTSSIKKKFNSIKFHFYFFQWSFALLEWIKMYYNSMGNTLIMNQWKLLMKLLEWNGKQWNQWLNWFIKKSITAAASHSNSTNQQINLIYLIGEVELRNERSWGHRGKPINNKLFFFMKRKVKLLMALPAAGMKGWLSWLVIVDLGGLRAGGPATAPPKEDKPNQPINSSFLSFLHLIEWGACCEWNQIERKEELRNSWNLFVFSFSLSGGLWAGLPAIRSAKKRKQKKRQINEWMKQKE